MVREKFAVRLMPEERNQLEHMVRAGMNSARVTTRARILLKTDEGWSAPKVAQGGPSSGCGRGHGVPHQAALRRGWVGRGAQGPDPAPPVPQAGCPGRSPSHRPDLQSGPREPRPLESALAGGPDGGVGSGRVLVPRNGAPAPEKTPSSRGRRSSGAFPR